MTKVFEGQIENPIHFRVVPIQVLRQSQNNMSQHNKHINKSPHIWGEKKSQNTNESKYNVF